MNLPFEYGEIVGKAQFIDRVEDRKKLAQNLTGGLNTMLISPRRWGKSSLVHQVASEIQDSKNVFCFIDLFHIKDEQEFYKELARVVIQNTSGKIEEWLSAAKTFLKNLSPTISIGVDPINNIELGFDYNQLDDNYREILDLAEKIAKKKRIRIIICIDEFQNLTRYDDPLLFQQRLRASWQHHKHVSYCLYGSKKHMMVDIFQNKSMPFYKFGDIMMLEKIAASDWINYIVKQFKKTKKEISPKLAEQIVNTAKRHSYYVQQLAHLVWVRTVRQTTQKDFKQAKEDLLKQNAILFTRETDNLSKKQINFLTALTEGVTHFHSNKIISKYGLGSSSNVSRIKEALEKKEIIDTYSPIPEFLDPAFEMWFRKYFA